MRLVVCCAVGLAAGLVLLSPGPAAAQGVPSTSRGFQPPVKQKNLPEYAPQTQPPALPGTLNLAQPAAPTQSDLGPTESLFDSINRGDIAAARDAISRGADLGGHNILGMTPLDLSVDLGRNDITFLLLSLHAGTVAGGPPAGKTKTATASAAPPKPSPKLVPAPAKPAAVPVAARIAPPDPGTPNPQAGFLGFGSNP
jgi:hypothetical protein